MGRIEYYKGETIMTKIPDISKITGKFDIQGIVKNVKSMISPGVEIPETAKGDPIMYKLSEITKELKILAELHVKQADELAKLDGMVGSLYQDITTLKNKSVGGEETLQTSEAPKEVATKETEKLAVPETTTTSDEKKE